MNNSLQYSIITLHHNKKMYARAKETLNLIMSGECEILNAKTWEEAKATLEERIEQMRLAGMVITKTDFNEYQCDNSTWTMVLKLGRLQSRFQI